MGTTQLREVLLLSLSMLASHAYAAGAFGAATATVVSPISVSAGDLQLRLAKGISAGDGRIDMAGIGIANRIEVSQMITKIAADGGTQIVMQSLTISYE